MERYKLLFMKRGLYIFMDKLKFIALRNLFKKVFLLY